jgi:hypothetical protein
LGLASLMMRRTLEKAPLACIVLEDEETAVAFRVIEDRA